MAPQSILDLNGLEKACILLVSMGTGVAAEVFKHLTEPEIEQLSAAIIKMQNVDPKIVDAVIKEFEAIAAEPGGAGGGKSFAAQVLEQAMGQEKANELMDRAATPGRGRPFGSLWDLNAGQLAKILKDEHPQVSALVITFLPPGRAAMVLGEFPEELQGEVALRICTMQEADPDVLSAIEETLQAKLTSVSSSSMQTSASDGPKTLVDILNNADRSMERNILGALQNEDPEVGEQVRDMIFTFEDLPKLEDRAVQLVLREVEQEDLRLALKGADEEIQSLIFKNMSERAAEMLKEDLELVGNAKTKDIEAAQQKLVAVVRRLLAAGEASMKEAGEEQSVGAAMSDADLEAAMMAELNGGDGSGSQDTCGGGGLTDEQSDQVDVAA